MDDKIKEEIRKMALQNAFEHGSQTQDKIILGKILGAEPEFRTKVKEVSKIVSEVVASVNQLSVREQQDEIEREFPELLRPREKVQEKEGLPELPEAKQGKVVTRFQIGRASCRERV